MRAGLLSLRAARLCAHAASLVGHLFWRWGTRFPPHKALGCSGSLTLPWCWGGPGSAQALGAFLKGLRNPKGAREPFGVSLELDLPTPCLGRQACFTLSDRKQDCSICYLCCSVFRTSLPDLILSRASPSSFPSSSVTSPCRHPSEMHQAPSFSLI